VGGRCFAEAQQAIDWYLAQPDDLVITLEPHNKHLSGLTALLHLYCHKFVAFDWLSGFSLSYLCIRLSRLGEPNLNQINSILTSISQISDITSEHYCDVLEAYLKLSEKEEVVVEEVKKKKKEEDSTWANKGIDFYTNLVNSGVIPSSKMQHIVLCLLAKVRNFSFIPCFWFFWRKAFVSVEKADGSAKTIGRIENGNVRNRWKDLALSS